MFWSFCYVAFDQIFNNAANVRYMSGGLINVPIVFRGPANGGTNVGRHSTPTRRKTSRPILRVSKSFVPPRRQMQKACSNRPFATMIRFALWKIPSFTTSREMFLMMNISFLSEKPALFEKERIFRSCAWEIRSHLSSGSSNP